MAINLKITIKISKIININRDNYFVCHIILQIKFNKNKINLIN